MVLFTVLSCSLDVIKVAQHKQGAIAFNNWVLMTTLASRAVSGYPPNIKLEVLVGLVASVMGPGGQ